MSLFEVMMLVCFGAAWPMSIYKSWKSRKTGGKSVGFLFVILAGYLFGSLHKIMYNFDNVFYLYLLNGLMVLTDILLYYRNCRIEKMSGSTI